MRVMIAGAAGNLGSLLARHLLQHPRHLRLLIHNSPLPADIASAPAAEVCGADLSRPDHLDDLCRGVDCIVHLAGVLFAPHPERFLPTTNIAFVRNLAQAATKSNVGRFILASFPHVEGETTPDRPATDRLDASSQVIHFQTRLAAEKCLLAECAGSSTQPVILRAGVVYGRGVKLTEGARWLLRKRLLAVWSRPTWVHLIALPDFLNAVTAAIEKPSISGIYNLCDDHPLTLQEFLDTFADHLGYRRPWRLPVWVFRLAAATCETLASLAGTRAPLTRDILRAGMTSSVADNTRMKRELIPALLYPSLREGITLI